MQQSSIMQFPGKRINPFEPGASLFLRMLQHFISHLGSLLNQMQVCTEDVMSVKEEYDKEHVT
jgi:hypothetical protein